jgi:hypothetical protein
MRIVSYHTTKLPCTVLLAVLAFLLAVPELEGPSAQTSEYRGRVGQVGCRPVKERTGETGCWILVNAGLGSLSPFGAFASAPTMDIV